MTSKDVICKNCGHGRNGHIQGDGYCTAGCPCPGFESVNAAESLPAQPKPTPSISTEIAWLEARWKSAFVEGKENYSNALIVALSALKSYASEPGARVEEPAKPTICGKCGAEIYYSEGNNVWTLADGTGRNICPVGAGDIPRHHPETEADREGIRSFVTQVLHDEAIVGRLVCGGTKAPQGWACSRELGHDGPCAAIQTKPAAPGDVREGGEPRSEYDFDLPEPFDTPRGNGNDEDAFWPHDVVAMRDKYQQRLNESRQQVAEKDAEIAGLKDGFGKEIDLHRQRVQVIYDLQAELSRLRGEKDGGERC